MRVEGGDQIEITLNLSRARVALVVYRAAEKHDEACLGETWKATTDEFSYPFPERKMVTRFLAAVREQHPNLELVTWSMLRGPTEWLKRLIIPVAVGLGLVALVAAWLRS